jgi:hypothetical protein
MYISKRKNTKKCNKEISTRSFKETTVKEGLDATTLQPEFEGTQRKKRKGKTPIFPSFKSYNLGYLKVLRENMKLKMENRKLKKKIRKLK